MQFPCCAERVHHACAGPSGPHSAWILPVPSPALRRPPPASGTAEPGGATWTAVVGRHGSPVGRGHPPRLPPRTSDEVLRRVRLRTTDDVVRLPPGPGRHVAVHSCVQPRGQRKPCSDASEARHPPAIRSTRREVVPRNVHRLGRSVPVPVGNAAPDPPTPRQRTRRRARYVADLAFLHQGEDRRPTTRWWGRPSCTRHGDEQGATRGVDVDEQRSLCTAVELSTCRQQKDADHPQRANRPGGHLTCGKGPGPQLPHV